MAYDTVSIAWYIQLMVKLGNISTSVIVTKLRKLEMYVLCWQQMGSILME